MSYRRGRPSSADVRLRERKATMYPIDERDKVEEIDNLPRPDAGAPLPLVVAENIDLLLAYRMSEPDPDWDSTDITVKSADSEDEPIAVVQFRLAHAHYLGMPNDEAFSGHPLYERGLRPCMVAEVLDSSWVRGLERMNSVHPHHDKASFAALRHLVFAFHDSTFECVATGLSVTIHRGSMREIAHVMVDRLA